MKIEYIFAIFGLIAVLDKIFGNHFKLGDEFEKGFSMAGPLIISMAGIVVLTPLLSKYLSVAFGSVLNLFGMDMSVVATFFPVDSGGALIAYELCDNRLISGYNGIIVASMFGATICPVIPMALNIIDKKYHGEVILGFLCGLATIPVGCIVSGLIIGLPLIVILINSAPTILVSVLICIGLIKKPEFVQKIISVMGNVLFKIMLAGLGLGVFEKLTGIALVADLAPIDDALLIIGYIVMILSGIFPLLAVITKVCNRFLVFIGKILRINTHSVMGLITTLANCIPMFGLIEKMDKKGRCVNIAFAVSAGFVFGDHLAFTLSFDNEFSLPLIVGKLISGISSVILIYIVINIKERKQFSEV